MKTIRATEGMWLTQVGEATERIYAKAVILAVNDTEDSWREATNDEREAFLKATEEQMMPMTPKPTETEEE